MDANAPIGVFDSGLGGLSTVRQLRKQLPGEDIVFFGDTGRVPYGTRGRDTIINYAKQDIAFLLSHGVKMLIAACGTISSTLPTEVSDALPVPYIGVVQSTAEAAVKATKNGRIGVLGTQATIASRSYENIIRGLMPDAQITATACPLFVPLVENGYFNPGNPVTTLVAKDYLKDCKAAGVDTVILGCTHFPLIKAIIGEEVGADVVLVDSGQQGALAAKALLTKKNMLADRENGSLHCFVSDSTESFHQLSSWFLGEYAGDDVQRIRVDGYTL